MKTGALLFGSFFGFFAILLGAFGAHKFKEILSLERLTSFETGVKYQMYHAIVLLIIGFMFDGKSGLEKTTIYFFIFGTILFSCSIYLLSFQEVWQVNLKFLGPITPLGGLLMMLDWALLFWNFLNNYKS